MRNNVRVFNSRNVVGQLGPGVEQVQYGVIQGRQALYVERRRGREKKSTELSRAGLIGIHSYGQRESGYIQYSFHLA